MTEEEWLISRTTLSGIIECSGSIRKYARLIGEDYADLWRWKNGSTKIRPEAVIKICKLEGIQPQLLRPDIFLPGMTLNFKKEK